MKSARVYDEATVRQAHPMNGGETTGQWQERLAYRFVFANRQSLRDPFVYGATTTAAGAADRDVCINSEPVREFTTAVPVTDMKTVDLVPDRLPVSGSLGQILARPTTDPRVLVCTRAERDNPKLWPEIRDLATRKNLLIRFSP